MLRSCIFNKFPGLADALFERIARLRPEGWDEIFRTQYFRLRQEQIPGTGKAWLV